MSFFACFSNTLWNCSKLLTDSALHSQSLLVNRTCCANSSNMCFDLIGHQSQNVAKVSVTSSVYL
jgi:hypothetical protein